MSPPLVPIITRAGLAAVRNARNDGLKAEIAFVAVGRGIASGGTFKGYAPAADATALRTEISRVPILSGAPLGGVAGADPIGFRTLFEVPPSSGATYEINELGWFLADGTLLCLWSDPTYPFAFVTPQASIRLAYDLFLTALPVTSLTITVTDETIPDTTAVLAALLRGLTRTTTTQIKINERLVAKRI